MNVLPELAAAMDGVERLFLLVPDIGIEHTEHAVAAARAAGVRHIVYLSSYAVIGDPVPAMGRWHRDREQLTRASGIPAMFLRLRSFMTNAFDWLPTLRAGGYTLDPVGPGRAAPIDPADIAAVAAVTLTEDDHEGEQYLPTGGETFTVAEQAQILAKATGCDIEVRAVATPAEAVRFPLLARGAAGACRRPHQGVTIPVRLPLTGRQNRSISPGFRNHRKHCATKGGIVFFHHIRNVG